MSSRPIRVLVADDHPVSLLGLVALVRSQHDLEVVAEAGSAAGAIEAYLGARPDVALLDFQLSDGTAVDVLDALRREDPAARVLVLTGASADEHAYRALRHGAAGYLLKSASTAELVRALREVASGGRFVPPAIARAVAARATEPDLSPREIEVLGLVAAGRTNPEIALALSISLGTARAHVSHVLEKLGAADRAEATAIAIRRGLV